MGLAARVRHHGGDVLPVVKTMVKLELYRCKLCQTAPLDGWSDGVRGPFESDHTTKLCPKAPENITVVMARESDKPSGWWLWLGKKKP